VPDLSVDIERDESGNEIVCAKFSDNDWELNVRALRSRFSALRSIRTQDWNSRSVVAVGVSAGADVFWSSDGAIATIMVGQDDETWDVAVTVPVDLVDDLVRRVDAL
jgi:hypothetical protein